MSASAVRVIAALSATLCAVALLCASAQAAEEETHIFDAERSLTGDCSVSASVDPVPDPGLCPMPPGVPGVDHPLKPFTKHGGVTVDAYGNRYVASAGPFISGTEYSEEARIDIFDSSGNFVSSIGPLHVNRWQMYLAVDSAGNLYLSRSVESSKEASSRPLVRFEPTVYNPAAGEIEYGKPPVAILNPDPSYPEGQWTKLYITIAINPANDHLFVDGGFGKLEEFASAADGNAYIGTTKLNGVQTGGSFATPFVIDAARKRIYISSHKEVPEFGVPQVVKAFNLEAPHELLFTIDGTTTPTKRFISEGRALPLVVDEDSGHIFVGDLAAAPTPRVYEFDATGQPVSTIGGGRLEGSGVLLWQMAYDNGPTSPTQGDLFVPSDNGPARSIVFKLKPALKAPGVEALSVSGITAADAILHGKVNPNILSTSYRIEYVTEQAFQEHGESFEGATVAGTGTLEGADEGIAVSASVSGLQSGTGYRFRIVAENELGQDEADAGFATYATPEPTTDCPNQLVRSGPSSNLPDCRAFELVTPADTNGHPTVGLESAQNSFAIRQVSPSGDRLTFRVEGGALPGIGGTGNLRGDPYLATRTPAGWITTYSGPSPAFASNIIPGATSPEQTYSFWATNGEGGPAQIGNVRTTYLRFPDGHQELLPQGSVGFGGYADAKLITEGGGHAIFVTGGSSQFEPAVRLEPEAAPDGTKAIYDRTIDGALHVVSLKPGNEPFGAGEQAFFRGASLNGVSVAFEILESSSQKDILYLRYNNAETFELGKGVDFAGFADDGSRAFYLEGGNLKAFDVASESVIDFSSSGDVIPAIISSDGAAAYFVSPSVLDSDPNSSGDEAQAGGQNLYLSREGQVEFVATVTDRDVEGGEGGPRDGFGFLTDRDTLALGWISRIPARTSPDGSVLLFKSRAKLTDYDNAGYAQIYRYDSMQGDLRCLSCNPTGEAPSADARLQSEFQESGERLLGPIAWPENLRADGRRAYFESSEGLVANDVDDHQDVYQWEDEGVGSCSRPGGCLDLISSGQSGRDEYLWGVSRSGDDVFIVSSDLLAGGDADETLSIYDARVGGGYPPPPTPAAECLGEACQPAAVAPNDPTPASSTFDGAGNVPKEATRPNCRKGKRAVRRAGEWRCVRKAKHHSRKKPAKNANSNRRAGR